MPKIENAVADNTAAKQEPTAVATEGAVIGDGTGLQPADKLDDGVIVEVPYSRAKAPPPVRLAPDSALGIDPGPDSAVR